MNNAVHSIYKNNTEVLERKDEIVLAEGIIKDADPGKTGLNGNVIVIGGTGSGKTVSYTEANLLHTFNRSLVVSVSKQQLIDKYVPLFQKRGYEVNVIDTIHPENSTIGYDPLRYVKSNEDVLTLAKALICNQAPMTSSDDSYWTNAATQLCAAEIAMVKELYPVYKEKNPDLMYTFASVLALDEELQFKESKSFGFTSSNMDLDFEALKNYNEASYAARCFQSIKGLASRTVSCILSTVRSAYGDTFSPSAIELMQMENTLDFADLANKKSVLFVLTSPVDKTSHAFANLMFSQMFKELYRLSLLEGGSLKQNLHVMCDDFAVSAKIHEFENYISIFREAGISVSILVQSLSQLTSLYGDAKATTIINNCDRILYLGGMDLSTCQNMAQRLDVPLTDVLNAKLESAFVMQRGERPIIGSRYKTYEDFAYEEVRTLRREKEAFVIV